MRYHMRLVGGFNMFNYLEKYEFLNGKDDISYMNKIVKW